MPSRNVGTAYLAQAAELAGNPGQLAAYNSQGHCVVLAGPGSGKTKTLVLKLARILAEDVEPLVALRASLIARSALANSLAELKTWDFSRHLIFSLVRSMGSVCVIS